MTSVKRRTGSGPSTAASRTPVDRVSAMISGRTATPSPAATRPEPSGQSRTAGRCGAFRPRQATPRTADPRQGRRSTGSPSSSPIPMRSRPANRWAAATASRSPRGLPLPRRHARSLKGRTRGRHRGRPSQARCAPLAAVARAKTYRPRPARPVAGCAARERAWDKSGERGGKAPTVSLHSRRSCKPARSRTAASTRSTSASQ